MRCVEAGSGKGKGGEAFGVEEGRMGNFLG